MVFVLSALCQINLEWVPIKCEETAGHSVWPSQALNATRAQRTWLISLTDWLLDVAGTDVTAWIPHICFLRNQENIKSRFSLNASMLLMDQKLKHAAGRGDYNLYNGNLFLKYAILQVSCCQSTLFSEDFRGKILTFALLPGACSLSH